MGERSATDGTDAQRAHGHHSSRGTRCDLAVFWGNPQWQDLWDWLLDMKASLTAYIYAVKALISAGVKIKVN